MFIMFKKRRKGIQIVSYEFKFRAVRFIELADDITNDLIYNPNSVIQIFSIFFEKPHLIAVRFIKILSDFKTTKFLLLCIHSV